MSDVQVAASLEPVLIAGLGSVGRRHLNNLRALGCREFICYRSYRGTLDDADLPEAFSTADLSEALARRPRSAVVANPTSKHLEVALAAAQSGCHLFVEKPLSHTLNRCHELAGLVRDRNLTTMIGCQFRFHPLLVGLRRQLAEGRIGAVLGARAEWGEFLPDWHPWEDHRQSYSARGDLGGGVVLTLIHPLDYLYWMFGPVSGVQAAVRRVPSLQTSAGDDWAEITLQFAGGPLAQVHLDYVQKPAVHRLVVWGDEGRAVWDYHAGTLRWQFPNGSEQTERVPDGFERNHMFVDELRHFADCVAAGRDSDIPLHDGIAVLDIALRARGVAPQVAGCE